MNRTLQYNENGNKILRRDYNVKNHTSEYDLLKFINCLSDKGIININKFSEILKESLHEIVIEKSDKK